MAKPSRRTKQQQLIELLQTENGATAAELSTTLGWQPHTVRAPLTGLRKAGHAVARCTRGGGASAYSLQHRTGCLMRRKKLDREGLARELASLLTLDRGALKERWENLYGSTPPERLSRNFLQPGTRLPAAGAGDRRPVAADKACLDRTTADIDAGRAVAPVRRIKTGTKLLRDWQGITHEVMIVEDGVLYAGERYRSLSEVASRITGAHWSGPAFFGLVRRKRACRVRRPCCGAARSIPANPRRGWSRISTRSMPSEEACEAFIRSQRSEAWKLVEMHYDDGGISGGTMERPTLQRLFDDTERDGGGDGPADLRALPGAGLCPEAQGSAR